MNFGVGAGDAFSLTMLAWNLYRNCKGSGEEFKRVTDDLKNIHIILKDIDETIENDATGLSRTGFERLDRVRSDTRSVLEQLERELEKYGDLDTKTQKKWDALRWGMKDVSDIKLRLISITTNLNMFSAALTNASHTRIEKVLMKILAEVKQGYHEGSVLSDGSVDSLNTKEAWQQLRKELEEAGIDAGVLQEKRAFIVDLIVRAKSDGTIDEADIPDFDAGFESDTDLSTTRTLIEEEYENRQERLKLGTDEDGGVIERRRSEKSQKPSRRRRLGSLFGKLTGSDIRILEAADAGDLGAMLKLIKSRVNIQTTDRWDWTALHMAAYGGYDEMTKVLIEEGADLDARTVDDETPRHLAEMKGRVGVVRIIEEEEIRRVKRAKSISTQSS